MRTLRSRLGLLGTLALAGLSSPLAAQPVGEEFRVNSYIGNDQQTFGDHLVAADANGNFVVVWNSYYQDGSRWGVFGQRYDSAGAPLGAEFRVNSYTTDRQLDPSVAMAGDGRFVVVWTGQHQDGSGYGIFGQRYDAGGVAQGNEFSVNSYTTGHQLAASVAADPSGNFVVVWASGHDSGSGIFGQRFDSAGVALAAEFRVNSFTTSEQTAPSVASDASGDFVVVWQGAAQDGSSYGTFGQRYDSQGVPLGEEFQANSYTTGNQQGASVASDATGNFVVVWQGSYQDGDETGIFGQRFDSAGVLQGGEFQVNTHTTDHQVDPSVASDANGNFLVAWESRNQDGNAGGIFGQRYDSSGARHGHEFQVNTFTSHGQQRPSVGALSDKLLVVVWESDLQDGSGYGAFGQRIDLAGDTIPPAVVVGLPNGGEQLFTESSYLIEWTASDDTALSSFDVLASVDGGGGFAPIAECQDLPDTARSCLWLAPGPPSASVLVRVVAEDTSGNTASDDSDAVFRIVAGMPSVTLESPNTNVEWRIGSVQSIEWTHNLGPNSTVRIELDRNDDGTYEALINAAAPADDDTSGSFAWIVLGPPSGTCRVRVAWTGNLAFFDAGDATFQILPSKASEFQVNTYTTGDQETGSFAGPLIAADSRGNLVVVWESDDQDGSSDGIFGQRYDSAGGMLGAEFRVNSYTTGLQREPAVASAASGNFIVVWEGTDGDGRGVFGQRFDGAGGMLGPEFRVNSTTSGEQDNAAVAAQSGGAFVVVWESGDDFGLGEDILGQRYDSAGSPQGGEFRVNTRTMDFQYQPSVAADASGNSVVAWASTPGGYGAPTSLFGQRFHSDGAARGDEFHVSSRGSPPSVASDAGGNFVVVWHVWGAYGGEDVYGRRYDSAGVPQGPEFRVNSFTPGYQEDPSVASDASGNFVVAWSSPEQDGHYAGIFGQRYDAAGLPQGGEFQINSYTTRSQRQPAVGAASDDQFVVVWTSDRQDGDDDGVFGRRFNFGDAVTVVTPNTNVKWSIGSLQRIRWTHTLGAKTTFRIELDRDDDGEYEELIAAAATVDGGGKGSFAWIVTGPRTGAARVRVSWTDDPEVADASDATFQIRPVPITRAPTLAPLAPSRLTSSARRP